MTVGENFVVLFIIVDDMVFAEDPGQLLNDFKKLLREEFDVKLFG